MDLTPEQLAEAKANGYTEDDIKTFVDAHNQPETAPAGPAPAGPAPSNQFQDRTEEYKGLAQGIGGKALEYGLEGIGGYYGAKKLLQAGGNAFRGAPAPPAPPAPVAPATTFTGGANPAWDAALSKPYTPPPPPPPTSPAAPPTAQNFIQRMAQQFGQMSQQAAPYVQKAAPIVRAGGVALAGMAPATLNSNEQEELARRDPNYARFLANRPRYPGQQ